MLKKYLLVLLVLFAGQSQAGWLSIFSRKKENPENPPVLSNPRARIASRMIKERAPCHEGCRSCQVVLNGNEYERLQKLFSERMTILTVMIKNITIALDNINTEKGAAELSLKNKALQQHLQESQELEKILGCQNNIRAELLQIFGSDKMAENEYWQSLKGPTLKDLGVKLSPL